MSQGRVLLVVFDGLGYDRERGRTVATAALDALPADIRQRLSAATARCAAVAEGARDSSAVAMLALCPVHAEALEPEMQPDAAVSRLMLAKAMQARLSEADREAILEAVRDTARAQRYVPWAARSPVLDAARNDNLTFATHAAGKWAGFEDVDPVVMGNSDTGHQQIGNLWVAPQTAREISESITTGAFFENEQLLKVVRLARNGGTLHFSILLSGIGGADGRVHSSWNHLEAFLELIFTQSGLRPDRVQMQAILDGRDSPADSSITRYGAIGDYLWRLERLLEGYGATRSLAWIIGRNIAMDRDFREENTEADYLLLTRGQGEEAQGFAGAREAIARRHAAGIMDPDTPPLVVTRDGSPPAPVQSGDAFVNLNFRADRQRARTAALIGHESFLLRESEARGRPWGLQWMDRDLDLSVCTLAEYHPELVAGTAVAFLTRPQPGNFLALFDRLLPGETYSLIGESNKSAHVGYFIRGRREEPVAAGSERRHIIPSASEPEGVRSDSDFYMTPAMRSAEIAAEVRARVEEGRDRLVVCNFSNCDMLGHLLPRRFEEAVAAYEAVDRALATVLRAARAGGYDVILTSDHGNVEADDPAHTANDVLTTIIPAERALIPAPLPSFQARLFDIPWTLGVLLGVGDLVDQSAPPLDRRPASSDMIGRPLVVVA